MNRPSLFQTQTYHPAGARGRAMDGSTTDSIKYLFWWVRWAPFQAVAEHTEWSGRVLGEKDHLRAPMSGQQGWGTWHKFPLLNVTVVSNDLPFFSSFLWKGAPFLRASGPRPLALKSSFSLCVFFPSHFQALVRLYFVSVFCPLSIPFNFCHD